MLNAFGLVWIIVDRSTDCESAVVAVILATSNMDWMEKIRRGSTRIVASRTFPHTGGQLGSFGGGGLFQDRIARTRTSGCSWHSFAFGSIASDTAYSSRFEPSVPSGMSYALKLVIPWSCHVVPLSYER